MFLPPGKQLISFFSLLNVFTFKFHMVSMSHCPPSLQVQDKTVDGNLFILREVTMISSLLYFVPTSLSICTMSCCFRQHTGYPLHVYLVLRIWSPSPESCDCHMDWRWTNRPQMQSISQDKDLFPSQGSDLIYSSCIFYLISLSLHMLSQGVHYTQVVWWSTKKW